LTSEIHLWAGNVVFMAHSGFMPKLTKDITARLAEERFKQFEKSDSAILKTIARRQMKLDASRNPRRVVETANRNSRQQQSNRPLPGTVPVDLIISKLDSPATNR
jgi:hypothetical protein